MRLTPAARGPAELTVFQPRFRVYLPEAVRPIEIPTGLRHGTTAGQSRDVLNGITTVAAAWPVRATLTLRIAPGPAGRGSP